MDMLPKGDIAINKHDKEKKGDIAMTLGDAAVGSTVVVTKITGDGAYKTSYYGHGDHKRK